MNIYKLRVIVDTVEDVFRDIEINTDASFLDLHSSILKAFGWDGGEMAAFYMSNETWDKGDEIPLMDMTDNPKSKTMKNCFLDQYISRPDEKLIYVYDFLRMWCFYIELIEVRKSVPETIYPKVVLSFGEAPPMDSKEVDLFDDMDFSMDFVDEGADKKEKIELTGDPEIDAYLLEEDEDDEEDFMDNIDDLEGLI